MSFKDSSFTVLFFPSSLHSSCSRSSSSRFIFSFFFVLRCCKSEDQIVQSPTQRTIVQSTRSTHPTFNRPINQISSLFFGALYRDSSDMFFLCSTLDLSSWFIFKFDLFQVHKLSLRDSVLLFRTRVYKTRDLCGIILPTHQVGIKSLTLEF